MRQREDANLLCLPQQAGVLALLHVCVRVCVLVFATYSLPSSAEMLILLAGVSWDG